MKKSMFATSIVALSASFVFFACSGAKPQDVFDPPVPVAAQQPDATDLFDAGVFDATTVDGSVEVAASDAGADTSFPVCVPESDQLFCSRYLVTCGASIGLDNCGAQRAVAVCGSCKATEFCNGGACSVIPCVPETDAALCATAGKTCGVAASLVDNCGKVRSPDCGGCAVATNVCKANTCCAPETDAVFCANLNKDCGVVPASPDNCGVARTPNCGKCPVATDLCTANKCTACVPKKCGVNSCGQINDGCNAAPLDCGVCGAGLSCIANACSPNVVDHNNGNGRVMPKQNVYVIYWGTGFSATTSALYSTFLAGIGGSAYAAIDNQYLRGAVTSITYKTSYFDIATPILPVTTDAQIQAEIDNVIVGGHLPYDADGLYFVITPNPVSVTTAFGVSCKDFCGYHGYYPGAAGEVVYSVIPSAAVCPNSCGGKFFTDATSPNSNLEADDGVSIIAHEMMEAQSDPNLNAWFDAAGYENADKCAWQFGVTHPAANGAPVNQSWGGKSWLVQQNWSNAISACTSN